MINLKCEKCGQPATHVDSVPDPMNSKQGQQAYRKQFLCRYHAATQKLYVGNTTRIEELED